MACRAAEACYTISVGNSAESSEDERIIWLGEAHTIISDWESQSGTRRLSVRDAALLAERIADALARVYHNGKEQRPAT
jgi:hypothetical protein